MRNFTAMTIFMAASFRPTSSVEDTSPCPNSEYRLTLARRFPPNARDAPGFGNHTALDVGALVAGKRMLEVGGPTPYLNHLYSAAASVDLVVFAPLPTGVAKDASYYEDIVATPVVVDGQVRGRVWRRHGTCLHGIEAGAYDVVLAAHNLEHYLDPLAALTVGRACQSVRR